MFKHLFIIIKNNNLRKDLNNEKNGIGFLNCFRSYFCKCATKNDTIRKESKIAEVELFGKKKETTSRFRCNYEPAS
jgi:hypothetical protein